MLFPESFNLHINLVICRKLHIRWNKWPSLPGILPLTVFSLDVSYRQAWKLNQLEVGECTESSHPLIKTALYPFSIYTNIFHLYMCLCLYRGVCMYKEWTPHIILIPRKKKKKKGFQYYSSVLLLSHGPLKNPINYQSDWADCCTFLHCLKYGLNFYFIIFCICMPSLFIHYT